MKQDDDMLRLNAALDGELGVEASVEFEARLARDPALQAAWTRQRALRTAIREGATLYEMPTPLRTRISEAVGARARNDSHVGLTSQHYPTALASEGRRRWAFAAASAVVGASLGGGLAWRVIERRSSSRDDLQRIAEDAVAGHVRATLTDRLIDVASSDQHTVKPWLTARLTYAPPVPDLSAHGFELAGARQDVIDGQVVAVLVYRRSRHSISAFVRPTPGESIDKQTLHWAIRGFNVVKLTRVGMAYLIVSDLNVRDLGDFTELLIAGG